MFTRVYTLQNLACTVHLQTEFTIPNIYGVPCIVIDAYRTVGCSLANWQRGHAEGKLYKAEEKIKQLKEQIRDRQHRGWQLCFFMFGSRYCWSWYNYPTSRLRIFDCYCLHGGWHGWLPSRLSDIIDRTQEWHIEIDITVVPWPKSFRTWQRSWKTSLECHKNRAKKKLRRKWIPALSSCHATTCEYLALELWRERLGQ